MNEQKTRATVTDAFWTGRSVYNCSMIVCQAEDRLRIITQHDHACFAADLLSLWRIDGWPDHPRRREILFAAREHDNGWREADSAPFHSPETGRPHDFMTLDLAERQRIWRRGPARYVEKEPWATALILRHAQHLHRDHRQDPAWIELFGEWDEMLAAVIDGLPEEESAAASDDLDSDYHWVDLSDALSLAICAGWHRPVIYEGMRGDPEDGVLRLDPFPLAGQTTFEISCRYIPDRRYRSDSDLAVELATARWEKMKVQVQEVPSPWGE